MAILPHGITSGRTIRTPPNKVRRGAIAILDGDLFGTSLNFPLNPTTLKIGTTAIYSDDTPFGRSYPISQYTGGAIRPVTFTIPVETLTGAIYQKKVGVGPHRPGGSAQSGNQQRNNTFSGVDKLERIVNFLEALTLPRRFTRDDQFTGTPLFGPPAFLFIFGDRIVLRCKMRSVEVEHRMFDERLNTIRTVIQVNMVEDPDRPHTFEDRIRSGNRLAGVSRGI